MTTFISLYVSAIIILLIIIFINKSKANNQLTKIFSLTLFCTEIWVIALLCQFTLAEKYDIPPIYFDYVAYIGICFLPIGVLFTALCFAKTHITFKKRYLLLFIVPVLTLAILWTNDLHHLMYEVYSIQLNECVTGPYMLVHNIYSYGLLLIGMIYLLRFSFKSSGFFSKQSLLIFIGFLIPIIVNIIGTFRIAPMTIYVTPISFAFAMLFFAFAIFKFNFLSVTPIALQRVVNRMTDGYIVLSTDNVITDFNLAFLKMFNVSEDEIRSKKFLDLLKSTSFTKTEINKMRTYINNAKLSDAIYTIDKHRKEDNKYFHIEITGLFSENANIGTLVLVKDTTQHVIDLQTIENNQNLLMERERLASLGQLIGGIAHNLKTPIMSISGAAEGLTDLIKEYNESIGDPEVTNEDHHAIAKDMSEWVDKIRSYTEYMSDVITAVKGQAVTLSENDHITFDIDELVKRVDILMKHELKNALVTLNISINVDKHLELVGDITSLVQVINNMISNSIQAYGGEPNNTIDLIIDKNQKNLEISVRDYGPGLPEEVKQKLFKEMITTKGKNGTGLGLFMSYSTIRAHFNGNITFESEKGKGTVFHIILPLSKL